MAVNILVSNDDGINAQGIIRLVKALSEKATVYVSAPHTQRSAAGHSITVHEPIQITETSFPGAAMALQTTGTPADCVKLGIKYFQAMGISIDMVYSGINHGGNLGTDTLYSGTVSAAMEGLLCEKPSVAVSVNNHQATHFDMACRLAVETMHRMEEAKLPLHVININTPDRPEEEIKGVCYTRLGVRDYEEWFEPEGGADGVTEYRYRGKPVVYNSTNIDIDVIADQEGYASITPLMADLTDHEVLEKIRQSK